MLLAAAAEEELLHPSPAYEQGTGTPGPADLVGAQGSTVHAQMQRLKGDLAESLDRIRVEQDLLAAELLVIPDGRGDFPYRLDPPRFIILLNS